MKAVVLAAGKGTRMLPLTKDKPKHMIDVNGKPFVDYIISSLRMAGITEIFFIVNYKKEIIEKYLKQSYPGIEIVDQGEPKGTGHAVLSVKDVIGNDEFIVIMGDNLYSPDDIRSISSLNGNVIAGLEVDDPSKYGVLVLNDNKLIDIIEKPTYPSSNMINTGLYKFTASIFQILERIKKSPRGEYELTDGIKELSVNGKMNFYRMKHYWLDFGKPSDIEKVENFLKN